MMMDWVKELGWLGEEELTPEKLEVGKKLLLQVLGALHYDMEEELGFKLPTLSGPEICALIANYGPPGEEAPKELCDGDETSSLAWVVGKRAEEVGLVREVTEEGITLDNEEIAITLLQGGIASIRYKLLYDWPELERAKAWVRENVVGDVRTEPFAGEKRERPDKTFEELEAEVEKMSSDEARKKFDEWVGLQLPVVRDLLLNHEMTPDKLYRVLDTSTDKLLVPGSIVSSHAVEVMAGGDHQKAIPAFRVVRSPIGCAGSIATLGLEHVEEVTTALLRVEEAGG